MTIMNEDKIKQRVKEQIARNLVDTLAVSFIAEKIGIDIEKVEEFRREYKEGL